MTLTEYLEKWLSRQRLQVEPTTWATYRMTVDCYVAPALGAIALDALDPSDVEQFYVDMLDHGRRKGGPLALGSVRYIHALLHKALADAVRLGLVRSNVSDRAVVPRIDPRADGCHDATVCVWTAPQARRFLTLTTGDQHHDLWAVALGTGMRRGELLGLRWADVADDHRQVRVATSLTVVAGEPRLKSTKTQRVRRLHLDPRTAATLERLRHVHCSDDTCNPLDLVFTDTTGQPLAPQRITHRFRRLVRRLDVPTIRLHDLRHTHATLLLQSGASIKVVSERLGHTTIAMTMDVYAHVLPAMDQDAADRFGDLLG